MPALNFFRRFLMLLLVGFVPQSPRACADDKAGTVLRGNVTATRSLVFSPDGKTLFFGGHGKNEVVGIMGRGLVERWDVAGAKNLDPLEMGDANFLSLAISDDGKRLAAGYKNPHIMNSMPGGVILWDLASGKQLERLFTLNPIYVVAFSPDNKTLAIGSYFSLGLYDTSRLKLGEGEILSLPGTVLTLAFSPDSKFLAAGGSFQGKDSSDRDEGFFRLWDLAIGKKLAAIDARDVKANGRYIDALRFSPDGKMLAVASGLQDTPEVALWDVAARKYHISLLGHVGRIGGLAFSSDGRTLASCSSDRTIKLWDIATGKEQRTLRGHTDAVGSIAFSPDGKALASISGDGTLRLWRVSP